MRRRIRCPRAVALARVALLASVSSAAAEERRCAVSAVEGAPARLWIDGAWSNLSPGPLPSGSVKVATGPGARLEILCDGPLTITVGAGAEVNLEALMVERGPAESVVLQLIRGIVGLVAPERDWKAFEVRTPLAIASVRSTEWLVEHADPTGSAVFVRDGSVSVRFRAGAPAALGPGEGVSAPPDGPAQAVVRWGPARIAGAGASLGFGWR